uniref:F-box/LRR-repeat protein 15-like leucin rich repeat domain-containing protein n=1 Tax=Opuntia streptacantha TaxID=393608 RepID=A0A7C8ZBF2_OPUST
MPESCMPDIPDEIWERIISLLDHDRYLEPLSIVSKTFLSITNRLKQTLTISEPTLHFIPKLFCRFPNLKHISFSNFPGSPDSILHLLSHAHFPLESLDLSNNKFFPSDAIRGLPTSSLSSIRSLKLSKLTVLNDLDLGAIAELMGNLEELDLSDPVDDYNVSGDLDIAGGCLGITDDGVDLLASKLCNLRKVNLSGNYMISDKSVMSLAEKCLNLEEIVVKNCTFVTQNGVGFAFRSCGNLRSVGLLGMDLTVSEISESLACARNLSVLDFSYMDVSDELLFAIAKASIPLKKLTLYHCKDFTFVGVLSLLRSYPSLEYLALEGVYWVSDRSIIDLSKFLRQASTVKLSFCSRLTSSAFFTMLKNCPSLSSLEMEKAGMGQQSFAVSNVYNPGIRALILGSNKTLSNECLEKIALSCPNLELLDISDCPAITRKGIGEIVRHCTRLRHLQMSGCLAIKSLGIDAKLQKLEELHASGSGLNDEGLIVVARKCPALIKLDVTNCSGVTSKGVKEIVYRCTRLREINLHWCRDMGRDIVAWMVFSRPSLRKIVPPCGFVPTENEKSLFLLHGCHVCQP